MNCLKAGLLASRSTAGSDLAEAEHVHHRIEARLAALAPERRPERAAGEDGAVLRAMGDLDPLAGAGEDHAVVPHDRAAPQAGEADVAGAPGSRDAVASPRRVGGEVDAPSARSRLAQEQ